LRGEIWLLFVYQKNERDSLSDFDLTQKDFAEAVGVNLRTLQDWETGRSPMLKPVEILMNLMKDIPIVKKHLLRIAAWRIGDLKILIISIVDTDNYLQHQPATRSYVRS
jgi:transcriptional regulator with XRE-family HTH domain